MIPRKKARLINKVGVLQLAPLPASAKAKARIRPGAKLGAGPEVGLELGPDVAAASESPQAEPESPVLMVALPLTEFERQQPAASPTASQAPALSSWALPLPKMPEPLVVAQDRPVPENSRLPGQDLVPWRDGLFAPLEDWVRSRMAVLSRLFVRGAPTVPDSKAANSKAARNRPTIPAIARANREIAQLRKENEQLRLQVMALEEMRKLAGRSHQPA